MKLNYKSCKVDVVSLNIRSINNNWSFEEILTSNELIDKDISVNNKIANYELIENSSDFIIGFIRCEIDKDLPAKINKTTKTISALDINEEEAITYGNVFLFDKRLNVLFYEINRSSIFLDAFRKLIYAGLKNSELTKMKKGTFSMEFGTIFRKNEYLRALNMDLYKRFKLKVHQPQRLLQNIRSINTDLDNKIKEEFCNEIEYASQYNTDIAEITYNVNKPKSNGGLNKSKMEDTIRALKSLLGFSEIRQDIDVVEVAGYSQDFDKSLTPINLVGDVYCAFFKIEIPRLDKDLQKNERVSKIKELVNKEFHILESYI